MANLEKEVAEEFAQSLRELRSNEFYAIRNLTTIAKESLAYAHVIAREIECAVMQCPPSNKLTYLYVMDSIVKNVRGPYLDAFANRVVNLFQTTLETNAGSPDVVHSLNRLLETWGPVFPLHVVEAARNIYHEFSLRNRIPLPQPGEVYRIRPSFEKVFDFWM